jgi:hypothetical protein
MEVESMRTLRLVLLVSALLASALRAQPPRVVVPDVAMEDQFEKAHDVRHHRGAVVVLIYGDRASADANRALGEQLHVAFHPSAKGQPPARARTAAVSPLAGAASSPEVVAVPVACIGKVPQLVRRIIRGQIKGGAPEVPVWLDFEDLMKTQFPFKAGVPNVVVLDTQGRYRYAAAGTPTRDGMEKLLQAIEGYRREAVTAAAPK